MAYANTYKRREMKFLLDEERYELLLDKVSQYMTEDEFGLHTIMNIYLDSANDDLIRGAVEKPVYREKLRLRAYGSAAEDGSEAFLEIKKKFMGVTYKRRLGGCYKELFDYVTEGKVPTLPDYEHWQVFSEIDYLIKRLGLIPRIVICYDREAFYGDDDSEFRLTFDGNIRVRRDSLDLREGCGGAPLQGAPFRVMEVKSAGAVPMWLVRTLSENKIYQGSFSKYATAYGLEQKLASGIAGGFAPRQRA